MLFSAEKSGVVQLTHHQAQGAPMYPAKHIRFSHAIALVAALILVLMPVSVFAQSSNGSISGNVTDDTGAALPGVTVTATNAGTSVSRTVVTNSTGHFEVALLP